MAGEQGAWRCAEGGATPLAVPLPEPPPAAEPGPTVVPLPDLANDPALGVSAIDTLLPATPVPSVPPPVADLYTLKVASVSAPDEIPDFVDSYGLDPSLVRYMPITEGENTRQLILWGRFVSRAQAARAVVAMPGAVQAIRPQIAEVAGLAGPIRSYAELKEAPAETAAAAPHPRGETAPRESVAASPTPAVPAGDSSPPAPAPEPLVLAANEPVSDRAPRPTAAAPARVDPVPEDPVPAVPAPADPVLAVPDQEPEDASPEPAVAARINPEPVTPGPAEAEPEHRKSPAVAQATDIEPTPRERPSPARPAAPQPEPRPTEPAPAAARASGPPQTRGEAPSPTAQRQANRPVARARVQTATAFLTLPAAGYCIQLTSLSSRRLLTPYLQRHGVDPREVYALDLDEGAGVRTLLLTGSFTSLVEAEAARDQLPSSVRSPWVRTVGTLQNKLRDRQ